MRILTFILSLYITALSIVPCSDGVSQSFVDTDIEASVKNDYNHSDHKDDCTPFCVCICCGSTVVMTYIPTLVKGKVDISTDYLLHYTFDYSFSYSQGIWHPPTLS